MWLEVDENGDVRNFLGGKRVIIPSIGSGNAIM